MLSPKLQRLALEAGDLALDVRAGRRVVTHADPVIRVHPGWLATHGLGDVVQDNGGLVLDSDGHHRYRFRAELADGFGLYERVTA